MIALEHSSIGHSHGEMLHGDEGRASKRFLAGSAVVIAGAAAVGAVLGTANGLRHREIIDIEKSVTIEAPEELYIDEIFTLPRLECYTGLSNYANGTQVQEQLDVSIFGLIPLPDGIDKRNLWWETNLEKAHFTTYLCQTGGKAHRIIDEATRKSTVTIDDGSAFEAITFPTDPSDTDLYYHDPESGIATKPYNTLSDLADLWPNFDPKTIPTIQNEIRGIADMAAASFSAESCGPVAYKALKKALIEMMITHEIEVAKLYGIHLERSDVTVILPDEIVVKNQYAEKLDKRKQQAENDTYSIKITLPEFDKETCEAPDRLVVKDRSEIQKEAS